MTNVHINRVIRGNKRKRRESAEQAADRAMRIGREMLKGGTVPSWIRLSAALGYNTSGGGGGMSAVVKELVKRNQWPIRLDDAPPAETMAIVCKSPVYHDASDNGPPPAADELETLREIRVRLDGLSTAARALVRSWL
jgi:hypothetical protein